MESNDMTTNPQAQAAGHGHVVPRPDGVKARCGGPAICRVCQRERAALEAEAAAPAVGEPAKQDAWFRLVWEIGQRVNCLASSFPDGNAHILRAIAALAASTPSPQPAQPAQAEDAARRLYSKWCDEQGIHCNRLPAWSELSAAERRKWLDAARQAQQPGGEG